MSVSNANGRLLMRYLSIESLQERFVIPEHYITRLVDGFKLASIEADKIQTQFKTMMKISNLSPGTQLVRTDTGEVVAEAERIIKGNQ
jgi:hypothetical protein